MYKTKILLVDDHMHFRKALRLFLESHEGFEIVGEASNGLEFLDLLEIVVPDVVLIDIRMPIMDGLQASKIVNHTYGSRIKTIAISTHNEDLYLEEAIKNGIQGFVSKNSVEQHIINAIDTVKNNRLFFLADKPANKSLHES